MQILVRSMTGKTIPIELESYDTIGYLKAMIEDKEGIPADEQLIVLNDNELQDDCFLEDYEIQHESTVYLILLLRGGGTTNFEFNSMKSFKNRGFSFGAPKYRRIAPGANFEGQCITRGCLAYNELAWANKEFGKFSMGKVIHSCYCPLCDEKLINVNSTGFFKCKWTFTGYLASGELREGKGETFDEEKFVYFGDGNNESWSYLKIFVSSK